MDNKKPTIIVVGDGPIANDVAKAFTKEELQDYQNQVVDWGDTLYSSGWDDAINTIDKVLESDQKEELLKYLKDQKKAYAEKVGTIVRNSLEGGWALPYTPK